MTTNRNLMYAVLFIGGGFILGTFFWAKMYPSDYNEWVQESGMPLPLAWEPVEIPPTPIVATALPQPTLTPHQPTATVIPTATNVPVPTPMRCTPDDVGDQNELEKLESAEEVTWLKSEQTYSIFLIVRTGEQICVGVGDWNVYLIKNEVNNFGLSDQLNMALQSAEHRRGFTGKATVKWTGWEVESITIETPKVSGPNDDLVRSIWPAQMKRINEAGEWLFKSPIFDETKDYSPYAPAYLCRRMGDWERIAPLPEKVTFCHLNWRYDIDSYLGKSYWLNNGAENDLRLKVFWIKPETVYADESIDYPVELKFADAGTLEVGQLLTKDYEVLEVLGTCEKPDEYELENSDFRDPVTVRLSGFGYPLVVPRNAYIGVGHKSGSGWETLYRVCPNN